jgi:perosamine synthetase
VIPYGRQSVDDDDVRAVVDVLRGDWLTGGAAVEAFEAGLREVTGARYAVAFASGTAALHASLAAAGIGPGDRVATSPLTFVASANAARYVGADVELLDIEAETLNVDPERVDGSIDALVAVHYAGLPVDLARLRVRPRVVVEDACHALGARTDDGPVGRCDRSDLCVFSFHPVKHVTTGEGGAVTTNDAGLAERLRRFRNHGIVPTPEAGGWAYEVRGLGFNYRITDIQCALGSSQLRRLEAFLARREALAQRYRAALADLPVTLPPAAPPGWRHAYHRFTIRVPAAARRHVYDALRGAGIGVQVHYVPVHHHPAFAGCADPGALPETERAYAGLLSLPLYPALTDAEQDRVVVSLADALATAALPALQEAGR